MAETKSEHELNTLDRYKYAFLGFFSAVSIAMAYFSLRISPPAVPDAGANIYALLLGISIPLIIYAIAKKATHSTAGSLFASALSAPIQIYTWKTVSQFTHTLAVVLFLLTILAFLYLKETDWRLAILFPIVFAFVHIYSLALIPIYLLYMLFVKLEQREVSQPELYFMTISSAFILGVFTLFQATPALLLIVKEYAVTHYYSIVAEKVVLHTAFIIAGTLPIYLGFFGAYESLVKKRKSAYILLAGMLIFLLAMLLNIIPVALGTPYFTLVLACLSSFLYKEVHEWLETTKFKKSINLILIISSAVVLALGILHRIVFLSA
ncbi:MAG: hypothetical protein AABX75_00255 [Nanoarchaeota archaeon]